MNNKNIADIEEQLLNSISGKFNTKEVLKLIVDNIETAGEDTADGWLELVQDALAKREDAPGMLKLMVVRGRIGKITPKAIEEALVHASNDRVWQAKVKSCDFTGKTELPECFRRLTVLNKLSEGSFCFEKTWGFGVVKRLDAFYSKITVDFTRKKHHQMSFGYAAESLRLLDDNHLFVLLNRAPEKISEIKKQNPGEIILMLLRSVGSKSVDDIKDLLIEMGIIADQDWKPFWDAARKTLKKDPLVEIPAKRTQPITLLEKERGYDSEWAKELGAERDVLKIITMLEGLASSGETDLPEEVKDAAAERCAFVVKAAQGSQWDILGRIVADGPDLARVLGTNPVEDQIQAFYSGPALSKALIGLNVKLGTTLLKMMMEKDPETGGQVLGEILEALPANLIGDAAYHMKKAGKEDAFLEKVTDCLKSRTVGPVVFSWICRDPEAPAKLDGVSRYELVNGVIDMLEGEYNGEQLKAQNTIRTCFEDRDWLAAFFTGLPQAQLETLVRRIAESKGWEESSRRSVLAKLLKAYPDLQKVLASQKTEDEGEPRVTSWRSFKERSATLRKIVEVDIPANSKEIGIARSYGDLRENAEYKAAKEHQGIRMRRQEELERDLKTVQGTDFAGAQADKAGPGTVVKIRRPDGNEEEYCILGEWDRDEELNIISSQSRLAQCLAGASPGSTVTVPGKSGNEDCEVIQVSPPSEAVKAWIKSDPA